MSITDPRALVAALGVATSLIAGGATAQMPSSEPLPGRPDQPRVADATADHALAARRTRIHRAESFALAIGSGQLDGGAAGVAARLSGYDIVVVDGQEATRAQVDALRARGAIVLGYLSVGTIERGRPWTRAARRYRLEPWKRWDEWYARVSAPGYRRLIVRRIAPGLLARDLDGLFLDNVDMTESHPAQAAGMAALVSRLSRLTHGRGRLLAAQNGDRRIRPLLGHLDLWNREDVTSTWDPARRRYVVRSDEERRRALAAVRAASRRGIVTTVTDYARPGDEAAGRRTASAACPIGALPFASDIGLEHVPTVPLTCDREPRAPSRPGA